MVAETNGDCSETNCGGGMAENAHIPWNPDNKDVAQVEDEEHWEAKEDFSCRSKNKTGRELASFVHVSRY